MKNYYKNRQNSGITFISLVVTIIILLILAGISISMLSGDNSILTKAGTAVNLTEAARIRRRSKFNIFECTHKYI